MMSSSSNQPSVAVDVFQSLSALNLFLNTTPCTRFCVIEGQHRCELGSLAAFGYNIDQNHNQLPLQNEPQRFQLYSPRSAMYKNASLSFVVDRTSYKSGYNLIKTESLKKISKNHQVLASTDVLIPTLVALHSHLMAATDDYGNPTRQMFYLTIDGTELEKEVIDGDFDGALERKICSADNWYPSKMITHVESVAKSILLESDPLKSLLPTKILNHRQIQIEEQTRVVDKAFDNCKGKSYWMWAASKSNIEKHARGPSPLCRSYATIVASGSYEFSLTPTPYDVHDFKKRNHLKSCGKLIHDCVVNTDYQAKFHAACMYTAVLDLTQFILCIPFVRIAFHSMFQSIQDITVHPMNNMQWICNFVLTPCKTIADVVTYHVMKGLDKKFDPSKRMEFKDTSDSDTIDRLETKSGVKRKRDSGEFHAYESIVLEKLLAKSNQKNLNAMAIDPQCQQTLAFMNTNAPTRNKITTIVFARALEMYFNLLKIYASDSTILENNTTLQELTEAVKEQQKQCLFETSKLLYVQLIIFQIMSLTIFILYNFPLCKQTIPRWLRCILGRMTET